MKLLTLKFFILLFVFFIPNAVNSKELTDLKNLVIYEDQKKISEISFKNEEDKTVSLSEYKNKLLILNFWATWCEPCKEEMPSLDRLQQKYDKQDFQILAISVDRGPKKKSVNFFNEYEIQNIDLFFDDKNNIPREVRAAGLPFSFFIDQEGNQIAKFIGPTEWDSNYFQDYIDSNL